MIVEELNFKQVSLFTLKRALENTHADVLVIHHKHFKELYDDIKRYITYYEEGHNVNFT